MWLEPISDGFGETIAQNDDFPTLSEYIGKPPFETICHEYLRHMAKAGKLPIRATVFSQWWGNDPKEKKQTDLDVIAVDSNSKSIIIGECKWRQTDQWSSGDVTAWMQKTHLLAQYTNRYYYLFSKNGFKYSVRDMADKSDRLRLVTTDMLYD